MEKMGVRVCGHQLAGRATVVLGAAWRQLVPYQSLAGPPLALKKRSKNLRKLIIH